MGFDQVPCMKSLSINDIETRIAAIKLEIAGMGDIRPGALVEGVRPVRGKIYGTSWSLKYTFQGRTHTDYVPVRAVEQVRAETDNFKRLRQLIDDWAEQGIELSKARIQETKGK